MSKKKSIIRALAKADWAAWDALATQQGALFLQRDWLRLFEPALQAWGVFEAGGALMGGFTLYRERRWGLSVLRCAPFTPTCGPLIAAKTQNAVAILEERRNMLNCMRTHIEHEAPAICMLSLDSSVTDVLPFFWNGFKVVPNYTYLLNLSLTPEQIHLNMSPTRRNDISKAYRDGVDVRPAEDLSVVRDLVLATFGRQQKAVDRVGLDRILFEYAQPENSFTFIAYRGERPIAATFVIHDTQTAYYLLGGYKVAEKHHGAGAATVAAAIRHAQQLGLKMFDFEGSIIPPIERYFRGFGGRLTPYFTVNKAWLPIEMALKFRNRNRF
ncbi:MAG: GNAT family N-acetyltransferase [Kiritimatiellia bacterium]|jgi:hypothetical protein|nr:GNAT family N-acetyltransferase [Kiritimatiellia bacterium]